jgi:soluble lytic murein transglycosylase-like protein
MRMPARPHTLLAGALVGTIVAIGGPQPGPRLGLGESGARNARGTRAARAVVIERHAPVVAHADAARDDHQLHAFERDLAATGRVAPERARSLASVAVRQARAHRIPPALMLGVLLVENEPLDSRAVSSAGARGLMQVHPLWRPVLGPRYGFDLADDSTNLAMGAHILAGLLWRARSLDDVERGLLRYNGCRRALRGGRAAAPRSTRAAPCAGYPRKVRRRIEQQAAALCPSRSFTRCVVGPLRLAVGAARAPE